MIFLEYKYLYRREKAKLPGGVADPVPIGSAAVRRAGRQSRSSPTGRPTPLCLEAAARLEKDGFDAEVIDLRTVKPLDMEAILASVAKTGRLLIVHEDRYFSGLGAEIAARIADAAFSLAGRADAARRDRGHALRLQPAAGGRDPAVGGEDLRGGAGVDHVLRRVGLAEPTAHRVV